MQDSATLVEFDLRAAVGNEPSRRTAAFQQSGRPKAPDGSSEGSLAIRRRFTTVRNGNGPKPSRDGSSGIQGVLEGFTQEPALPCKT